MICLPADRYVCRSCCSDTWSCFGISKLSNCYRMRRPCVARIYRLCLYDFLLNVAMRQCVEGETIGFCFATLAQASKKEKGWSRCPVQAFEIFDACLRNFQLRLRSASRRQVVEMPLRLVTLGSSNSCACSSRESSIRNQAVISSSQPRENPHSSKGKKHQSQ